MNREIELQRIRARNARHQTLAIQPLLLSPLNVFALLLGFSCVALGYALSHTPQEQLAAWLGRPSIERTATAPGLGGSMSRLVKTW